MQPSSGEMVDTKRIEELRALVFASMPSASRKAPQLGGITSKERRRRIGEEKEEGEVSSDEEATQATARFPFCYGSQASERTSVLDKTGNMKSNPHLSAAVSTSAMPLSGIRKEAEAFLASLNIPLASQPSRHHSMPGEKTDSLVIKFSDEDSDSDVEHQQLVSVEVQPVMCSSENPIGIGNGLLESVASAHNRISFNQSTGDLKTEIDRVKRQIAAIERMKGKKSMTSLSGKTLKSSAMDVACSKIALVSGSSNPRAVPVNLESLRQQIAAKESELELRKQHATKDVGGSETGLASSIIPAASVSAQATARAGQGQTASSAHFDVVYTASGNHAWMIGSGQELQHMQSRADGVTDFVASKTVNTVTEGSQIRHGFEIMERKHTEVEISDGLKICRSVVDNGQKQPPKFQSSYQIELSRSNVMVPVNGVSQTPFKRRLQAANSLNESVQTLDNEGTKKRRLNKLLTCMQSSSPPEEKLQITNDSYYRQEPSVDAALALVSEGNEGAIENWSHTGESQSVAQNGGFSLSLHESPDEISNLSSQLVEPIGALLTTADQVVGPNSQGRGRLTDVAGALADGTCYKDAADFHIVEACHTTAAPQQQDKSCQNTAPKPVQGIKIILPSCGDNSTSQLSSPSILNRPQEVQPFDESLQSAGIEGPSLYDVHGNIETEGSFSHRERANLWNTETNVLSNLSRSLVGRPGDKGPPSYTEKDFQAVCIETNSTSSRYPVWVTGLSQDNEFQYESPQQLQEEDDLIEKELEEARQNRRRCEEREVFARRQYREAQEALHAANSHCNIIYQKRELLSARIQAAQIQNHLPRASIGLSAQHNEGTLVPYCFQGNANKASLRMPFFLSREERQLLHVGPGHRLDQSNIGLATVPVSSTDVSRELQINLVQTGSSHDDRDKRIRDLRAGEVVESDTTFLQAKKPFEQFIDVSKDMIRIKEVEAEGGHLLRQSDQEEFERSLSVRNLQQKTATNLDQGVPSGKGIVEDDIIGLLIRRQDELQTVSSEGLITIKEVEAEGVQGCVALLSGAKETEGSIGTRRILHEVKLSLQQKPGTENFTTEAQQKPQLTIEGVGFPIVMREQITRVLDNGVHGLDFVKPVELPTIVSEKFSTVKEVEAEEVHHSSGNAGGNDFENLLTETSPLLSHNVTICEKDQTSSKDEIEPSTSLIPPPRIKILLRSALSSTQGIHDNILQTGQIHRDPVLLNWGTATATGKYDSPLCMFRSYRTCLQFSSTFLLPIDSKSWSHNINPHKPVCMYELRGKCNNGDCPWQHRKDYTLTQLQLLDQLNNYAKNESTIMPEINVDLSREKRTTLAALSERRVEEAPFMARERHGGCVTTRPLVSKTLHLDWNSHINKPPTYHIGSYLIKADSITRLNPLITCKQQFRKLGFCRPFSAPLPIHRHLPLDMPCLIDPLARGAIFDGAVEYPSRSLGRHGRTCDKQLGAQKYLPKGLEDVDSFLEMALSFIDFDLNVEKSGCWKNALYVLSRALEAKPNSVALWVVYLYLFYRQERSVGEDDMFHNAVQYNKGSYELWLLFINSRKNLTQRLEAYELAIVSVANMDEKKRCHPKEQSSFILDLALQMLNFMCVSGLYQESLSWINDLTTFASKEVHDLERLGRGSALSLLTCVTKFDAYILWVSCAYVIAQAQLPDSVIERLGCKQQLYLDITWKRQEITVSRGVQVMRLMHTATSCGAGCLDLTSVESCEDKDTLLSMQAMAVNLVQCTFAFEGVETALSLGKKYVTLYPTSIELILVCVHLGEQYGGSTAGLNTFEEALSHWPQSEPGIIRLWCQYAAYALIVEGRHYVKDLLARCAAQIKENDPDEDGSFNANNFSTLYPPSFTEQSRHMIIDDEQPLQASVDGVRQSFESLSSVLKHQSSGVFEVVTRVFSNQDLVFGFLMLAFLEVLEGDMMAAQMAADKAQKTALDEEDVQHCLKEVAALAFYGSMDLINLKQGRKMLELLYRCFVESKLLNRLQPLSRRLSESIKKRRVRLFVECLLGPSPVDHSILNSILETCYGSDLLPEENVPLKELFDFVERILEIAPANVKFATSACRVVGHRLKKCDIVVKTSASIWSSSLLINSLFQSSPPAPEHYWLDAGHFLELLGVDDVLEDFYQHALSACPFSVLLCHRLSAINNCNK